MDPSLITALEALARKTPWRPLRSHLENAIASNSAVETFKYALDCFEFLLRATASPSLVACIDYEGPLRSGEDMTVFRREFRSDFARPSLGHWNSILVRARRVLLQIEGTSHPLAAMLSTKLHLTKFPELSKRIATVTSTPASNRTSYLLHEVFQSLLPLRNKTWAHGSASPQFYAKASEQLLAVLAELTPSLSTVLFGRIVACVRVNLAGADTLTCTGFSFDSQVRSPWSLDHSPEGHPDGGTVYFEPTSLPGTRISYGPFVKLGEDSETLYFYDEHTETGTRYFAHGRDERITVVMPSLEDLLRGPDTERRPSASRIKTPVRSTNDICHNLPKPDYYRYVERKEVQDKLVQALSHPRLFLVTLDGIGGSGKSALALYTAYMIMESGIALSGWRPDFVIWFSAKETYLTARGIVSEVPQGRTLVELLQEILRVVTDSDELEPQQSISQRDVLELLGAAHYLLILDNLETVQNIEELWQFLLSPQLPTSVRVLITTRHRQGEAEIPIKVPRFGNDEAMQLIESECERISITMPAPDRMHVYRTTGGIPLAIKHVLGQVSAGLPLSRALALTVESESDILKFCFPNSFAVLSESGKRALIALSIWGQPMLFEDLRVLCDFEKPVCAEAVAALQKVSFLEVTANPNGENVYSILPLTQSFAQSQLKDLPAWEGELLKRAGELRHLQQQMPADSKGGASAAIASPTKMLQFATHWETRGEHQKAKEWYGQAVKSSSADPYLWVAKARFEARTLGDIAAARVSLGKAASLSTDSRLLTDCAYIERTYGSNEHALAYFRRAVQANPEDRYARHGLGLTLFEGGTDQKNAGKAKGDSMVIQAAVGRIKEACDELKQAFFTAPNSEPERHHNCVNALVLSRALNRAGRGEEALRVAIDARKWDAKDRSLINWIRQLELWRGAPGQT